jgi:ribosome-associated toxin RatA of RatAB toxin-antitoxin module
MFALIADVESYPRFLPGCTGGSVLARTGDSLEARLSLARGPFVASFTTRNVLDPPRGMTMELTEGPFASLTGAWTIAPLGDQGCRVDLQVSFAFPGRARDLLLGPAFEGTLNGLMDAFVERARALYG